MKKISFLIVALVIVALAVFLAVGLDSNQASATSAYATQTGKACGYCHVAPGGGGPLTAEGQAFDQLGETTTTAGATTTTTAGGATTTTAGGATTTTVGGATTTTTAGGASSTSTTAAPTTPTTVPVGSPSFTG